MGQRIQTYSVLIVSAAESLNQMLRSLLSTARFDPVQQTASISSARRQLAAHSFDIVIINAPLPQDAGLRFAVDTAEDKGTIVLMIVRSEQHSQVYTAVSSSGIFTIPRPCSRQSLEMALQWLVSARERLRKAEEKAETIEEKMDEIRVVNRAKWLLIEKCGLAESEAHRFIEKKAMDTCVTRRTIAEGIIDNYKQKT